MPCSNIRYHFRNEKWIEPGSFRRVRKVIGYFVLKCLYASDAGREYHSDTIQVFILQIETGIFHCFFRSLDGKLRITVEFPCFLTIEQITGIKIFHFAGKLRFEK